MSKQTDVAVSKAAAEHVVVSPSTGLDRPDVIAQAHSAFQQLGDHLRHQAATSEKGLRLWQVSCFHLCK